MSFIIKLVTVKWHDTMAYMISIHMKEKKNSYECFNINVSIYELICFKKECLYIGLFGKSCLFGKIIS